MKIENLKYFLSVVQYGSINQAADKLFLSQQNLGFIIRNLEKELAMELFIRNHKGVTLTEDGEQFLPYAQQIVALYDEFYLLRKPATSNVLQLYTTPALGQQISELQGNTIGGHYYLSLYKHSANELYDMVKNNEPGIFFLPVYDGKPEFIAKMPHKYLIAQDHSWVTICHESSPLVSLNTDITSALEHTVRISDTYKWANVPNFINVNDLNMCKKLMREKGFIYSTTYHFYRMNFSDSEWHIIETKENIVTDYILLFHLEDGMDVRRVKADLLHQLNEIFEIE